MSNFVTGLQVLLEKSQDLKFDGNHPNNVNVGYTRTGFLMTDVKVGMPLVLCHSKGTLVTSPVEEVDEDGIKTRNSKYFITVLN